MSKYVAVKEVEQCFHGCEFFSTNGHLMECRHPDFDSMDWENKLIITHDNSRGEVPKKCPLRKGETDIILRVKLKKS